MPARPVKPRPSSGANATTPGRRVYRRAAERRAEIIAAARTVFVRSNLHGARTRDIAVAAGVNEATLFKHFPTKEALFQAAVMTPLIEAMRDMQERIEIYETAATPLQMANLALSSTVRHLEDMEHIFPLLVTALFSDQKAGRKLFREQLEPHIRLRGSALRALTKADVDPEFVGLAIFGMLFAVAMQRRLGGEQQDLAATAVQFNRLATSGFAREKSAPKGRKKAKR